MKKVICSLPNASGLINGVPFVEADGVMVADGLEDEVAAQFDGIPGYAIEDSTAKAGKTAKAAAAAKKAETDEGAQK